MKILSAEPKYSVFPTSPVVRWKLVPYRTRWKTRAKLVIVGTTLNSGDKNCAAFKFRWRACAGSCAIVDEGERNEAGCTVFVGPCLPLVTAKQGPRAVQDLSQIVRLYRLRLEA